MAGHPVEGGGGLGGGVGSEAVGSFGVQGWCGCSGLVRVRGRRGGALVQGQRVRVRSASAGLGVGLGLGLGLRLGLGLAGHVELEVEQAPAVRPCTVAAAVVRVRRRGDQADQVVHLGRYREI